MYNRIIYFVFLLATSIEASFMPAIELPDTKIESIKKMTVWEDGKSEFSVNEIDSRGTKYFYDRDRRKSGVVFKDADQSVYVTFRINQAYVKLNSTVLNKDGVMEDYAAIYQNIRDNFLAVVQNEFKPECTITFCGEGDEGALAVLAASDFLEVIRRPTTINQVRLVTFFAPPIADKSFIERLHERIHVENVLNFVIHPISESAMVCLPPGIQIDVLPTELTDDYGLRGMYQAIEMFGYCLNLYNVYSHQKIKLPSFDVLRRIVAHYQLSYFAYKGEFDNCDALVNVGNVSLFSTSRGLLKPFYRMIS